VEDYNNQAGAERAFAKAMGWNDWWWEEESEAGMVRGFRVQWSRDPTAGVAVDRADPDDARYVVVTGTSAQLQIHGWTTAGEARQWGGRIVQDLLTPVEPEENLPGGTPTRPSPVEGGNLCGWLRDGS
jgi:hypothetical protein